MCTLLDPIECLGCRVGLIIVVSIGKGRQFLKIKGQPIGFHRQQHESIFNRIGHRVEAHDPTLLAKTLNHSKKISSVAIATASLLFVDSFSIQIFSVPSIAINAYEFVKATAVARR